LPCSKYQYRIEAGYRASGLVRGPFAEAQKVHFNDGGQFDKLYTVK